MTLSAEFFSVLDVAPVLGRTFSPGEDQDDNPIVVLNAALWKARFGSDPDIVGKTVTLSDQKYTVIGVMQRQCVGAWLNSDPDVWFPIDLASLLFEVSATDPFTFAMVGFV